MENRIGWATTFTRWLSAVVLKMLVQVINNAIKLFRIFYHLLSSPVQQVQLLYTH